MYFKHKYITNPTVTPEDTVVQAAQQLINTLKSKVANNDNVGKMGLDHLRERFQSMIARS